MGWTKMAKIVYFLWDGGCSTQKPLSDNTSPMKYLHQLDPIADVKHISIVCLCNSQLRVASLD